MCVFLCLAAFTWHCSILCLCVDTNYSFYGKTNLQSPKCLYIHMRKRTSVETERRKVQFKPPEHHDENLLCLIFFPSLSLFLIFPFWIGLLCRLLRENHWGSGTGSSFSHFHRRSRSRLLRGSGINKPNIFLNYNHLPRSLRCLEAPT